MTKHEDITLHCCLSKDKFLKKHLKLFCGEAEAINQMMHYFVKKPPIKAFYFDNLAKENLTVWWIISHIILWHIYGLTRIVRKLK